jgi:iron transport multicopper oxidase
MKCTRLDIPYSFHSSQVDPILDQFEAAARAVTFHKPQIPVISPLLSKSVSQEGELGARYLSRHARESVNFLGAIQHAAENGLMDKKTICIEIGPHPVTSGMIKSIFPPANVCPSLQKGQDPFKTLSQTLATLYCNGIEINWNETHKEFECNLKLVDLPAYKFEEKEYWINYVNDWCLMKGNEARKEVPKPKISTSVHYIIREQLDSNGGKIVFQSYLSDPALLEVVSGHIVNGSRLCPSVSDPSAHFECI